MDWIPCSERLPVDSANVLCVTEEGVVEIGSCIRQLLWSDNNGHDIDVTHWMPLPPKP